MNAAVLFPATCRPASDVVLASAMFSQELVGGCQTGRGAAEFEEVEGEQRIPNYSQSYRCLFCVFPLCISWQRYSGHGNKQALCKPELIRDCEQSGNLIYPTIFSPPSIHLACKIY